MKDFLRDSIFLQKMIDAVPAMLFIVDRDVTIIHLNRAASQAVGSTNEKVLMKRGGEVLHCIYSYETPEGCGRSQHCPECVIRNSVNKAFEGQTVYDETAEMKLSHDGHVDDVFFSVAATLFNYKKNTFALVVLYDITRQKKTEEALSSANRLLEQQAMTDPLTGIYNRVKFDETLMKEISRSKRHEIPLSLVMFDVDNFKMINDTSGHHVGDAVLQELAAHISKRIRQDDYFARWGGDEFMILLTHNLLETAARFAEHLRADIERLRLGGLQRITCSFGVAQLRDEDDIFSLTKRTDEALYKAKASGRNHVEKS
ncbi:MAG: diguanylate cyclase [Dissulfurispiraceae bacterium]